MTATGCSAASAHPPTLVPECSPANSPAPSPRSASPPVSAEPSTRGSLIRRAIRRGVADTIFYQFRTVVQWHLLPGDLPPLTAVWKQFCRWRDAGIWPVIMGGLTCR
ncbi:MAG: transposase [Mycobacterium sp.]